VSLVLVFSLSFHAQKTNGDDGTAADKNCITTTTASSSSSSSSSSSVLFDAWSLSLGAVLLSKKSDFQGKFFCVLWCKIEEKVRDPRTKTTRDTMYSAMSSIPSGGPPGGTHTHKSCGIPCGA